MGSVYGMEEIVPYFDFALILLSYQESGMSISTDVG
jgi:hypothetical protein